ncbi:MAG: GNAT family N-acetyltransferase [Betaproteobacteria bacterium]
MNRLDIRPATAADIPTLCALGATTFRETYTPISEPREVDDYADTHFSVDHVQAWLTRPDARTLLALVDGAAVGYAHVRRAPVPACVADREAVELSRLYLLAAAQGGGTGGALIAAALAEIAALGGRTVWLGAYDRNVKALAFYARRGFVQVGTHAFEFGGQVYADPVFTRAL